ncbi:MAG: PGF-pre-PGF domain-containing protein, partial [Nanobdellota archaeon]
SPVDIDAEQGQKVNIDVSGTDMRISFLSTGSQTITGNITSVDREDIDIETSDNQIDFREIDIEGEIEDSNITFSVAKDRLDEEDAEPSQVYLQRYDPEDNEWEDLDTFILEEQEEKYMFEAEVPEFSLFATAFRTTTEETEDTKPPEQDTGRQASPLTGLAIDDLGQGSLIVTIIVALLFALLITDRQMGGMPWQNRIKRARNIHKRAERIYKAGNKEKAVRLYHKARRLRR